MNKFIIKDYKQFLLVYGFLYLLLLFNIFSAKDLIVNPSGIMIEAIYGGLFSLLLCLIIPFITISNYKYLMKTNQTKNSGKKNFCFHFFPILLSVIGLMLAIFVK